MRAALSALLNLLGLLIFAYTYIHKYTKLGNITYRMSLILTKCLKKATNGKNFSTNLTEKLQKYGKICNFGEHFLTHETDSTYQAGMAHTHICPPPPGYCPLLQIVPGERRTPPYDADHGDDTHRLSEEKSIHRVLRFDDHRGQYPRLSPRHIGSTSDEFRAQFPICNPAAFDLHNHRNSRLEHRGDSRSFQARKIRRDEVLSIPEMAASRDRLHLHGKNRRSLHFLTVETRSRQRLQHGSGHPLELCRNPHPRMP